MARKGGDYEGAERKEKRRIFVKQMMEGQVITPVFQLKEQ